MCLSSLCLGWGPNCLFHTRFHCIDPRWCRIWHFCLSKIDIFTRRYRILRHFATILARLDITWRFIWLFCLETSHAFSVDFWNVPFIGQNWSFCSVRSSICALFRTKTPTYVQMLDVSEAKMAILLKGLPNLGFLQATQDNFLHVSLSFLPWSGPKLFVSHTFPLYRPTLMQNMTVLLRKIGISWHAGTTSWHILTRSWHSLT